MKHRNSFSGLLVVLATALLITFYSGFCQQAEGSDETLAVCSFNIQFLGQGTKRDHISLAMILEDFDIVVVQELVAPPYQGEFPDGSAFKPDKEAAEFFDWMTHFGFMYKLSVEDTGTRATNHNNSSATEWWVVFYKPGTVEIADELPTAFLADDRTANPNYDRVPHAFAFRTPAGSLDFVLISVHLHPGDSANDTARRREELVSIAQWIDAHDDIEKDFIILGDMNIEGFEELQGVLQEATLSEFRSLNDKCLPTNTNVSSPKPYDQVMYRFNPTKEIDKEFGFRVFNLIEAMRPFWNSQKPYPGGSVNPIGVPAYDHDKFRQYYSDHHPVVFKLKIPATDDD